MQMIKLNSIEKGFLLFSAILIIGGLDSVICPEATIVSHIAYGMRGVTLPPSYTILSSVGTWVVGWMAIIFGSCLAAFALYRGKK